MTCFALTECEHTGVWRWAIINGEGEVIGDGREPTRRQAKRTAEAAFPLVVAG